MAELNLKQIIERLNTEFTGDDLNPVFWYDDNGEFAEDMKDIELKNARVYYLIYVPFPKPDVRENYLEDTRFYSRRFFADRALRIDSRIKLGT